MTEHQANRDRLVETLRTELVGPAPAGDTIDCSRELSFDNPRDAYKPYRQQGSEDEILQRSGPSKRYGVGVLYPQSRDAPEDEVPLLAPPTEGEDGATAENAGAIAKSATEDCERIASRDGGSPAEAETDDFDLSSANAYRPSCMAVSLLARIPHAATLCVEATGGRYSAKEVQIGGQARRWWLRTPIRILANYDGACFRVEHTTSLTPTQVRQDNLAGLDIRVELLSRPQPELNDTYLITVCLINREAGAVSQDSSSLFQSRFRVFLQSEDEAAAILPYPAPSALDEEERSLELLYRNMQTFAVGHGCAADWTDPVQPGRVDEVSAECLPCYETPNITPDIKGNDQQPLGVAMRALAGLERDDDGLQALGGLIQTYREWADAQRGRVDSLDSHLRLTAGRHLAACTRFADRMAVGLELVRTDHLVERAFRLANKAILLQQLRARREARDAQYDVDAATIHFGDPYEDVNLDSAEAVAARWRPFQIAFILASLPSTADPSARDRDLVELIWFPTGGGKTEAYLGLAAFGMILRRLKDQEDIGVHVLMRYTLRLLTAQQFQRAARLLCAMEVIRRETSSELGQEPFSVGIWLGGTTTPNTRQEALSVLRSLARADGAKENQFVLDRCPWCGAQMGPVKFTGPRRRGPRPPRVIGYVQRDNTVVLACPDSQCPFTDLLPVYVVDEDVYERTPSLVIGTVDKFAMLAWRPAARSLFGISADGSRFSSPPGLIIQDELHLISGPLGSMVGLYEGVIEELCTDHRTMPAARPKIVSSTATIRSYADQIKGLYARESVSLFPPPGLDAGDSFFAAYARTPDGSLERGRVYVGVHAPGLGSLQTAQVRTFSALLQGVQPLSPKERDPWWTLLLFFNSLRELGTTLSLFQSDIPDYLKTLRARYGLQPDECRRLRRLLELTGRLPGEEVPKAISALEVPTVSRRSPAVDVCLASSIIEVGIDIDRLSLLAVVGQPKTTSQYIQVTGRVGRDKDRPGLVVTIYTASKPRDRSHFEKFRSYHERLYAQVEPTSVTPFSRPALDRALHAVVASYVRQTGDGDEAESPYPFPQGRIDGLVPLLRARAQFVDPDEVASFENVLEHRLDEWRRWQRLRWQGSLQDEDMPLLRPSGAYVPRDKERVSWATPQSMRNVDAECQVEITQLYMLDEEDSNA